MSDAICCDAPDCPEVGRFPYTGWWRLGNTSALTVLPYAKCLDFCSWQCLGAYVMCASGDMADLQAHIDSLEED